ncbi:unnamed protein product [Parascedosporium putredinis]|uniref:superoxide dismutase n=1 Tax=Parascedosporium putredinis TaxID=1442378 RepID=A0A9P1H666_9PEZI|nr:unnamed protein product [Parascedosporium putredinis]CAI7998442.1 unnamed protein product [Parascedosporium putredinis]
MRYQSLLALALAATVAEAQDVPQTGELGDAIVVEDNPQNVTYKAEFPEKPFSTVAIEGNVKGSITAKTVEGGVEFHVKFENLPAEGGPFGYHLHVDPVPEDGNCTKTLAHLDPFIRGEATACNPEAPATCQVGDLSGKYGAADSGTTFEDTYVDRYVSLKEGPGSFFGNRSIVLHFANKTRITCANFALLSDDEGDDKPDGEGDNGGEDNGDDDHAEHTGTPTDGSDSTPSPEESAPVESNPSEGSAAALASLSLIAALAAAVFAL